MPTFNVDTRLQAYSLILQFLQENNLSQTLSAFKEEAKHELELLHHTILPPNINLIGILDKVAQDSFKDAFLQLQLDKTRDDILLFKTLPCSIPPRLIHTFQDIHYDNILCMTLHPTLPFTVITGSSDKSVRIFTIANDVLSMKNILTHHNAAVLQVATHVRFPNIVLTSSMDFTTALVDIETGEIVSQWKDHTKYVVRAGFSPSGNWIVTGSYDKSIHLYKFIAMSSSSSSSSLYPQYQKVHSISFQGIVESMAFLPIPSMNVITATPTTTTTTTNSTTPSASSSESSSQFLSETVIVGIRGDSYLTYISLDDSNEYFKETRFNMNANGDDWVSFVPMDICISPSNQHVLVRTDMQSGRVIIFPIWSNHQSRNMYGCFNDGFSQPRSCWDDSGRYIFLTSDDYTIKMYDVHDGKCIWTLDKVNGLIRALVFSQKRLYACGFDRSIHVWEMD